MGQNENKQNIRPVFKSAGMGNNPSVTFMADGTPVKPVDSTSAAQVLSTATPGAAPVTPVATPPKPVAPAPKQPTLADLNKKANEERIAKERAFADARKAEEASTQGMFKDGERMVGATAAGTGAIAGGKGTIAGGRSAASLFGRRSKSGNSPLANNVATAPGKVAQAAQAPVKSTSMIESRKSAATPKPVVTAPKRSNNSNKMPLIIGAVVAVLVIAVVAVVAMMPKSSTPVATPVSIPESALAKSFNVFANYYLYENPTEANLSGDFSLGTSYSVDNALAGNNTTFFATAQGYFDEFLTTYESDETKTERIVTEIEAFKEIFNFIRAYSSITDYTTEQLAALFTNNGYTNSLVAVNQNYDTLSSDEYAPGVDYVTNKKSYALAFLKLLSGASQIGCFSNGALNEECLVGRIDSEIMAQFNEASLNLENSTQIEGIITETNRAVFRLSTTLNGGTNEN